MMHDTEHPTPENDPADHNALDDDALDRVSGGTGRLAHEIAHTVQQRSSVGANQTLTVGSNQSVSVGAPDEE